MSLAFLTSRPSWRKMESGKEGSMGEEVESDERADWEGAGTEKGGRGAEEVMVDGGGGSVLA